VKRQAAGTTQECSFAEPSLVWDVTHYRLSIPPEGSGVAAFDTITMKSFRDMEQARSISAVRVGFATVPDTPQAWQAFRHRGRAAFRPSFVPTAQSRHGWGTRTWMPTGSGVRKHAVLNVERRDDDAI
jgi:hypothetical protein